MDNVILMKPDEQQKINRGDIERAMFSNGQKHKEDIRVQKELYPPLLRKGDRRSRQYHGMYSFLPRAASQLLLIISPKPIK